MSTYAATRKLIELIRIHDNLDSTNFDQALMTLAQGRPAYWTNVKYHAAVTWGFVYAANVAGIDHAISDLPQRNRKDVENFLVCLQPLNPQAKAEIARALATEKK